MCLFSKAFECLLGRENVYHIPIWVRLDGRQLVVQLVLSVRSGFLKELAGVDHTFRKK